MGRVVAEKDEMAEKKCSNFFLYQPCLVLCQMHGICFACLSSMDLQLCGNLVSEPPRCIYEYPCYRLFNFFHFIWMIEFTVVDCGNGGMVKHQL